MSNFKNIKSKIYSLSDLKIQSDKWKENGDKIVFTNGCFDILHIGHARLLSEASALGDVLILGLNSDASVARLKGPERPVNSETVRAEMLSCLESVDFVTVFDEDDPRALIAALKPDVHIEGGDFDPDNDSAMPEASVLREHGGCVKVIALLEGHSTTGLISKIRTNLCSAH